jgi:hypothetical protein
LNHPFKGTQFSGAGRGVCVNPFSGLQDSELGNGVATRICSEYAYKRHGWSPSMVLLDGEATLTSYTFDGRPIAGTDLVNMVDNRGGAE